MPSTQGQTPYRCTRAMCKHNRVSLRLVLPGLPHAYTKGAALQSKSLGVDIHMHTHIKDALCRVIHALGYTPGVQTNQNNATTRQSTHELARSALDTHCSNPLAQRMQAIASKTSPGFVGHMTVPCKFPSLAHPVSATFDSLMPPSLQHPLPPGWSFKAHPKNITQKDWSVPIIPQQQLVSHQSHHGCMYICMHPVHLLPP